jgi:hypothetical protein
LIGWLMLALSLTAAAPGALDLRAATTDDTTVARTAPPPPSLMAPPRPRDLTRV